MFSYHLARRAEHVLGVVVLALGSLAPDYAPLCAALLTGGVGLEEVPEAPQVPILAECSCSR